MSADGEVEPCKIGSSVATLVDVAYPCAIAGPVRGRSIEVAGATPVAVASLPLAFQLVPDWLAISVPLVIFMICYLCGGTTLGAGWPSLGNPGQGIGRFPNAPDGGR